MGFMLVIYLAVFMSLFSLMMMNFSDLELQSEILSSFMALYNFKALYNSFSIFMSLTVLLISLSVLFFCSNYFSISSKWFYFFFMVFICGMLLLVSGNSWFNLFLGWDLLGASSFVLISFYHNWSSVNSANFTFFTNRLGDSFFLVFLSLSFYDFPKTAFYFLALTAATKSAVFPFSSWLPMAMAAPTPVSALVHSSTLVSAGVVLLLLYKELLSIQVLLILFIMSTLSTLFASLSSLKEKDYKKIVALSTLSQISFMFMMVSSGAYILALFHMMVHAFIKSLLFLTIGSFLSVNSGTQETRKISFYYTMSKINSLFILVSVSSLSGLMFMSGFYSKDFYVLNALSLHSSLILKLLWIFIFSGTLAYSFKLLKSSMSAAPKSSLFFYECSSSSTYSKIMLALASLSYSVLAVFNYLMNSEPLLEEEKGFMVLLVLYTVILFNIMEVLNAKTLFYFFGLIYCSSKLSSLSFYSPFNFEKSYFEKSYLQGATPKLLILSFSSLILLILLTL